MIPNYDPKTGIHYGAISQNSVNSDALDDIFFGAHSTDMAYENWKEEIKSRVRSAISNAVEDYTSKHDYLALFLSEQVETWDNIGDAYPESEIRPRFEDGKYIVQGCLDSDLIVIISPYYTVCRECSPCVPNAGDLNKPQAEGLKTYCLGPEFFDENAAPYPIYKVEETAVEK